MIRRLLLNQQNWDKVAVIDGNEEISYRALMQKALTLERALANRARENIAIYLPNDGSYIAAFWGTLQSGMTAFPLNVLMTAHEMGSLLKQASVSAVVTLSTYRGLFEEIEASEALPLEILCMDELSVDEFSHVSGRADVDANEGMVLLGTSGTTGLSKIVQLSEWNVEASVLGYIEKMRFDASTTADVRFVLAAPFSSAYALMVLSTCLMHSFPIVLLGSAFTLDALFRIAEKYSVTHYEGSASVIHLMEQMAGRHIPYDIHTLTYFGFGGSKVSGSTIDRIQRAYPGVLLYQGYGTTEASPLITKHARTQVEKLESVGTAIIGMEIAVETEDGITHLPNRSGEIVARGPNVMLGYYHDEAETNRAIKNGWLYTGDIGYLDEEGYLYICGRKKNVIIVRGFNVYPEEVETCLRNSLLVTDCFAYGEADIFGSEMVCLDVVLAHPEAGVEQIRAYASAHLASYKQPHKITARETIKRTANDKTERRKGAFR